MRVLKYSDKKNIKREIKGKDVVLVGGCFDIVHFGHIKFLESAKKEGNYLVIALESDASIKRLKKKTPFHNISERSEILSSIKYVDLVIQLPLFKGDLDYFKLTEFIKPKIIAVSDGDKNIKKKEEQIKKIGGEVKKVSKILKKFSSTNILNYATILSNKSSR